MTFEDVRVESKYIFKVLECLFLFSRLLNKIRASTSAGMATRPLMIMKMRPRRGQLDLFCVQVVAV